MASALVNVDRFSRIARAMRVRHLDVVATSAVRDAANGGGFVSELERRIGHPVDVISGDRSEEHTSELQSLMRISYAVFCLKKKITNTKNKTQSSTQHLIIRHR